MTADDLWDRHAHNADDDCAPLMDKSDFLAALKEYGNLVKAEAVNVAEVEREGYDLTGQNKSPDGPNAFIVGYQDGCTDCAAAIAKMELP